MGEGGGEGRKVVAKDKGKIDDSKETKNRSSKKQNAENFTEGPYLSSSSMMMMLLLQRQMKITKLYSLQRVYEVTCFSEGIEPLLVLCHCVGASSGQSLSLVDNLDKQNEGNSALQKLPPRLVQVDI